MDSNLLIEKDKDNKQHTLTLSTGDKSDQKIVSEQTLSRSKCFVAHGETIHINNISVSTINFDSSNNGPFMDSLLSITELRKIHSSRSDTQSPKIEIQPPTIVNIRRLEPNNIWVSKYKPLVLVECPSIKTFFLSNMIFSQLANPMKIAENVSYRSSFVLRKNNNFEFSEVIKIFQEKSITFEDDTIQEFVKGINALYNNEDYNYINNEYKNIKLRKIIFASLCLVAIIVLIVLAFVFYNFFSKGDGIAYTLTVVLMAILAIILLIYLIKFIGYAYNQINDDKLYDLMENRIKNYITLEDFMNVWNKNILIPQGVFASLPVTMDYIHFTFNPFVEFNIQHHDIDEQQ